MFGFTCLTKEYKIMEFKIMNKEVDLIMGDSIEHLPLIKDKSIDISFTSPPYNRKRNDKYSEFVDINNSWYEMNLNVITQLLRVTKKHVIYNIQANYYNREDVYKIIGYFSDKIVDIHIWQKSNPMPAGGHAVTNAVEYFIVLGDTPLKSNRTYTKNIITTSVNSSMPKNHKAVMKTEVAEHFISNFTDRGDIVLDCFSGLGTTGVACVRLGRRYIGIEKIEAYYLLGQQRINEQQMF